MKFGSILTVGTICISSIVNAAPTQKREFTGFNADDIIAALNDLQNQNTKRDDDSYISSLLLKLDMKQMSQMMTEFSENPDAKNSVEDGIKEAITSKKLDIESITSAFTKNSGLVSKFFSSMLSDKDSSSEAMENAKRMWNDGALNLDESITTSEKRSIKRDDGEKDDSVSKLVSSLAGSDLTATAIKSFMGNANFINSTEELLSKSFDDVDFNSLFDSLKKSDLVAKMSESFLNSRSFDDEFSQAVVSHLKRGTVKRDDITGAVAGLAASANADASFGLDLGSSTTQASASTSDSLEDQIDMLAASETTSETAETDDSLLGGLFGDDDDSSSTTSTTESSEETGGSFLDDLLGGDDDENSTTSTTESSKETGGSFLDDLFGSDNSTTTTSSEDSTSTGGGLSDLFDSLFNTTDSSSKPSNSSGSDFSLGGFVDGLLDDIFNVSSSDTNSSSGGDFSFGDLIGDLFGDLFDGSGSSNSTSSGSDFSLGGFISGLLDSLFGGDGSSSSSSGSGSGGSIFSFIGDLIDKVINWIFSPSGGSHTSWGQLFSNIVDWALDALFDDDGSSSSSSPSSSSSSAKSSSSSGKQCCCSGSSKMMRKRALKTKFKRNMHKNIHKRAFEFKSNLYLKYL